MVEGGAKVITSFLQSGLVDRLIVTMSPCFVGADGIGYEGDYRVSQIATLHVSFEVNSGLRMPQRSLIIKGLHWLVETQ